MPAATRRAWQHAGAKASSGNDHGAGTLTYPKGARFQFSGIFSLVKYAVYEPQTDAPWSTERQFWQIGIVMAEMANPDGAPNGFTLASIRIYINTGGGPSASTETAVPRAELVSFEKPWDLMVEIDGWHPKALLRTADGRVERRVTLISVPERKALYVRLPLDLPETKRVLDGRPTLHYVLVCGYATPPRQAASWL
ncbi:MAG TPA: glucodextranase DOMON-like domain-containing protein [Spirochaetia bacterium]|nr:glucodextranase DOMON-like domain-containing protein [Spirochaetia bacterium]